MDTTDRHFCEDRYTKLRNLLEGGAAKFANIKITFDRRSYFHSRTNSNSNLINNMLRTEHITSSEFQASVSSDLQVNKKNLSATITQSHASFQQHLTELKMIVAFAGERFRKHWLAGRNLAGKPTVKFYVYGTHEAT